MSRCTCPGAAAELAYPTVADVAAHLGAEILFDPRETLHREVHAVCVAAMSVEHFLVELVDGTLVIVPGDRPDILVTSIASTLSPAIPTVSGIVLTGEVPLGETAARLLQDAPFPVLKVSQPTYVAATAVNSVRPHMRAENERLVATALGLFESAVDAAELERRIAIQRPERMTPIMFEYELIERAKADHRHIVLPEGDDDRVLRAAEILLRRGVVDADDPRRARRGARSCRRDRASTSTARRSSTRSTSPLRRGVRRAVLRAAQAQGRRPRSGALDTMADRTTSGR